MPLAVLRIVACAIRSEQGDDLPLGEGLIGNRREAPEPYYYALALVRGSRRA